MEYAFAIASTAHAGQTDKGGRPYILHAIGTACRAQLSAIKWLKERASQSLLADIYVIGLLHDVVEDTHHDFGSLITHGIKERHVQGVEVLTRRPKEIYSDYIRRIVLSKDTASLFVKIGDLLDHIAPERMFDGPDYQSLIKRDKRNLITLEDAVRERMQVEIYD